MKETTQKLLSIAFPMVSRKTVCMFAVVLVVLYSSQAYELLKISRRKNICTPETKTEGKNTYLEVWPPTLVSDSSALNETAASCVQKPQQAAPCVEAHKKIPPQTPRARD